MAAPGVVRGQQRHDVAPVGHGLRRAVQQEHRLARAADRVVDLHAVDLGPAVREPDSGMVSEVHLGELLLLFGLILSARYNQACVAVGVKGLQLRFPQYAWIAELVDGVILLTCGYAVYEAVDNPAHAWITTVILWITKKISIAPLGRLRRSRTGE